MKKLILFLLILFSFNVSYSQEKELSKEEQAKRQRNIDAVNPFARFNYTPKIGTLSKGKYLEVQKIDSVVQIGSYRFNQITVRVTGFVQVDTMYSEATLRPEIVSRWFNPDPLSDEFPSWSPYTFTNDNPIYFTDPTGLASEGVLDDYGLDKDGYITLLQKTDDKFDRLYAVDDNGNITDDTNFVQVDKNSADATTIITDLSIDDPNFVANSPWGKKVGAWAKTSNRKDAYNVFKFGSDNSNVEWALEEYSGNRLVLGNNHFSETVGTLTGVSGYDILDLKKDYHSHPGTSPTDDRASGQIGDQGWASSVIWKFLNGGVKDYSKHPTFHIYRPALSKGFQYSPWKAKFNEKKVKKSSDL